MTTMSFQERQEAIARVRADMAQALTVAGPAGEQLFALVDLALCGVMDARTQEDFIRQARARGLLSEPESTRDVHRPKVGG